MTINDSMVYVYEIPLSWGWRLGNILVYAVCFTQYSGESMSNLFEIIPHHLSFRFDPCFFIVLSRIYKTFHLLYRISRFNSQQFHSIKLSFEQFNDSIQDPGKWPENWGRKAHIRHNPRNFHFNSNEKRHQYESFNHFILSDFCFLFYITQEIILSFTVYKAQVITDSAYHSPYYCCCCLFPG